LTENIWNSIEYERGWITSPDCSENATGVERRSHCNVKRVALLQVPTIFRFKIQLSF